MATLSARSHFTSNAMVLSLPVELYRDLEEMMAERGIKVEHTTIYRWGQRYAPELDKRVRI